MLCIYFPSGYAVYPNVGYKVLTGWPTAVLHWQALCPHVPAKAASWRTVVVGYSLHRRHFHPPPRSDMKITRLKIQALTIIHIKKQNKNKPRIVTQGLKILLLMQHVHVTGFTPWHLLYHVTIMLHHGSHLSLRVSLRDGSAAQRLFLMTCYCKVVV